MNNSFRILVDMHALIVLFRQHSTVSTTLDELEHVLLNKNKWKSGHDLFFRVRKKTNAAAKAGDGVLEAQYLFEEVCAKTVFNFSNPEAPFDSDSPYWIVPNALELAKRMNIEQQRIVEIVAP